MKVINNSDFSFHRDAFTFVSPPIDPLAFIAAVQGLQVSQIENVTELYMIGSMPAELGVDWYYAHDLAAEDEDGSSDDQDS